MDVTGSDGKRNQHALCLKKSLFGLKQASANWYSMIKKGLEIKGFKESVADSFVFIKQSNKGVTLIFRNDVGNPPVKRRLVSVTNSKGGLRTLPDFNSSATNPTIKLVTEPNPQRTQLPTVMRIPQINQAFASTNNFWVKNFIESSSDIIVLVSVENCIILSRDKKSIYRFHLYFKAWNRTVCI